MLRGLKEEPTDDEPLAAGNVEKRQIDQIARGKVYGIEFAGRPKGE